MNLKNSFNFRGIESAFESALEHSILHRTTPGFQYLEIGVATGATISEVATFIREKVPTQWRATGIDLAGGPFFDAREFIKRTLSHDVIIEFNGACRNVPFVPDVKKDDIRIILLKGENKRAFVAPNSINFCLIDGCHGAPCVEADFLSVEGAMALGGIVAFHDAGIADQGLHFQNHCQMPIAIRKALNQLQLWAPPNVGSLREGWAFFGMHDGDKSPGNPELDGHGIMFFQKIAVNKNPYQEGFTG